MGKMAIGETPTQCAIRETLEETGILVEPTGFLGLYSDPAHIVAYSDGEVRQAYEVMLTAKRRSGEPAANDEAGDVRWSPPPTCTRSTSTRRSGDSSATSSKGRTRTWIEREPPLHRTRESRIRVGGRQTICPVRGRGAGRACVRR